MENITNHTTIHLHEHHLAQTQNLLETQPTDESFIKASEVFSQLCDPTRLKILWLLAHSEECVTNISVFIHMSPPAVSHHLRILRQSGLIVNRRDGKEMYYKLADTQTARYIHKMIDAFFDIHHDTLIPNK